MSKATISLGGNFAFLGTGVFSESSVTTMNARPWAEHAPRRDHWAIGRVRPPWYSEVLAYLDDPLRQRARDVYQLAKSFASDKPRGTMHVFTKNEREISEIFSTNYVAATAESDED